jgi:hypothetical protein
MDPKYTPTIKDRQVPNTQSDTRKLAIFQNDSDFYVIHKKAEKLAIATYMISNFFTSEEPLKWSLRRVVGELLKDTITLSSASLSVKDSLVRTISSRLTELTSLYEVAHRAGFISEMNFTIIKSELEKMLELLDRRESTQVNTKSISFDESFFKVERPGGEESKGDSNQDTRSVEDGEKYSRSHAPYFSASYPQSSHSNSQGVENKKYEIKTVAKETSSFIKDNNILKDIKDKRQNIIIALVKKHHTLTIKGFTSVIKDCSEKTIQRELLTLVAKGVLKKEGERRWSTYSMV